jgi:TP901 family phage tail tape measure protein
MLLIQTQAGASADEVKKLSAAVLELAKTAPQSPEELAKGLYHLESLGLRGAQAMNTLKISSIAAGMGIADLETVTSALGGAVVTGIKGAQDYQAAMNTLIATVGAGNVRMEDLAGALGNVAPAAAAAGVSLPELGAAMATLTDRGMSADEAATRLRMTFALLQNQSPKAKKALHDLGIDAGSLATKLRQPDGLSAVLHELHDAIDRVGQTRGNRDLLQAFGGGRSGLGIQTLIGSLNSALSSYDDKVKQVAADEQKAAAARAAYLASPAYKLHAALSSVQADLIKLGQSLTPAFTGAAKVISGLADAIDSLPGPAKVEIGVIVGLLAVAGPLALAVLGTIKLVDGIGNAFARLPGRAGPAIVETDAELAALRTQAVETAAAFEAIGPAAATGALAAEGELAGVEAAAVTATGAVSALSLGLLGLAGLVIPIYIEYLFSQHGKTFLNDTGGGSFNKPVVQDKKGNYFVENRTANRGSHRTLQPITKKQAAALGVTVPGVNDTGSGAERAAAPHGFTTPATTPVGSATTPPATSTPLGGLERIQLAVSSAQLATARGDRGAKQQLITALDEEISYDRHWEARQEDLLRRDVGDAKQHAKILQSLQQDEASALDQIASLAKDGAAARKKAADDLQKARDARIQALTDIPIDLRIEEVKADARGASAEKLVAIYKRERKALMQQLAELQRLHADKTAILQAWENIDSVDQKIRNANNTAKADRGANERELLDAISQTIGDYAPNVLGGQGAGASSVVVHQHFPHAPTDDGNQEAVYAKHAMARVFG